MRSRSDYGSAFLIPGISRSGAIRVGGLPRGLYHEAVARFPFLIATPIIFAPHYSKSHDAASRRGRPLRTGNRVGDIRRRDCLSFGPRPDAVFLVPRFLGAKSLRLFLLGLRTHNTGSAGICGMIAPLPPTGGYFVLIREVARF